jgi:ribosome modulation factor
MAKRLAEPKQQSNLTPNFFLEIFRDLKNAQREIDAATGRKRAILKRGKGGGIDLDAMRLMEGLAKLETEDAELRLRNLSRYLKWTESPLGKQGDLFGATDDQQPTEEARGDMLEWAAQDAGYKAGKGGDTIDTNPHPAGSPTFDRWRQGWHEGQAALAATMQAAGDDELTEAAPKVARRQTGRRRNGAEQGATV